MFRPVLLSLVLLLPAGSAQALVNDGGPTGLALALAATGPADVPVAIPELPQMASALALPMGAPMQVSESALHFPGLHRKPKPERPAAENMPLSPERTRILLRSLTVPGWGQATLGKRHAAAMFGAAELGIWTAFTSFRVQEILRKLGYERTAQLSAGIDLHGRDDEYRRIVGSFASSDEYNLYVVSRDAANIYLTDPSHPDLAGYRAYVAAHSITGADGWHWTDRASFDRYRAERKNSQRASLRANSMLGLAIANRLVSAVFAMRSSAHMVPAAPRTTSWKFEVTPGDLTDPGSFRAGLHASF